ncbi:MAG TPA: nicotinate-nucleotide adenylyltransferase [Nitrospiraceae bacterium]|nr:nicotinate-nucleotide adenylyltransferase [Nitrospiraceae bacterium]
MMRLGLLGGTFNPVHNCHLKVAAQTRDALALDRILFIPAGDPPHKAPDSLAPARHREAMVRLAIEEEPSFGLSDMEVRRPGRSYSIDTVRALRAELGPTPHLFFIIGLDAFLDLPSWKEAEALLRACHFVVVSRPRTRFEQLLSMPLFRHADRGKIHALDSGLAHRLSVPIPDGSELTLLRLPPCDISASEIRQSVRQGRSLANVLPLSVESYIIQQGLYSEDDDRTGS